MSKEKNTPTDSLTDESAAIVEKPEACLQDLIDELRGDRAGDSKAGPLLRRLRASLGLTQAAFGARLGQHEGTIRNWETSGSVPLSKASTFARLLGFDEGHLKKDPFGDICYVGGQPATVRGLRYILEMEKASKTVWVMRTNTPFLSGFEGPTRERMIEYMKTLGTEYRFLWADIEGFVDGLKNKTSEPSGKANHVMFYNLPDLYRVSMRQARDSHIAFARDLADRGEGDLLEKIKGWPVKNPEHIIYLGLGTFVVSVVLFVYTQESARKLKRSIDILFEIPTATYDPDDPDHIQVGDKNRKAWAQLDPSHAKNVYTVWRGILKEYETEHTPEVPNVETLRKICDEDPPGILLQI